jgi:hypothetical protein
MDHWWNGTGERRSTRGETFSGANFPTANITWTDLGLNSVPRHGQRVCVEDRGMTGGMQMFWY